MTALLIMVLAFMLGMIAGAFTISAWWIRRMAKPENMKAFLKDLYRQAHPHWLHPADDHDTRVCPCCGWNEKESPAYCAADHEPTPPC